jgi:hypothetical protein
MFLQQRDPDTSVQSVGYGIGLKNQDFDSRRSQDFLLGIVSISAMQPIQLPFQRLVGSLSICRLKLAGA